MSDRPPTPPRSRDRPATPPRSRGGSSASGDSRPKRPASPTGRGNGGSAVDMKAALRASILDLGGDDDDDEDEEEVVARPGVGGTAAILGAWRTPWGVLGRPGKKDKALCGWNAFFQMKPPNWQRRLIRKPWEYPVVAMHLAACLLQSYVRREVLTRRKDSEEAPVEHAGAHASVKETAEAGGWEKREGKVKEVLRQRYLDFTQRILESRFALHRRSAQPPKSYRNFSHFCAALIQGAWRALRGHDSPLRRTKRILAWKQQTLPHLAALVMQIAVRNFIELKRQSLKSKDVGGATVATSETARVKAVRMLQEYLKRKNDVRQYKVLRDLITFRHVGDPHLLLRSMLPKEAQLLDPAVRSHVKFRLGGAEFPPQIYFKIYAKNVVDLNAFAPRAYHSPGKPVTYERFENNGWRVLNSGKAFALGKVDALEQQSANARTPWHHDRRVRASSAAAKRKTRKLLWIEKMQRLDEEAMVARIDAKLGKAQAPQAPLTDRTHVRASAGAESLAGQSFDFDIGESSRGSELLFADGAEVKRHTSNRGTLMDMAALGVELGADEAENLVDWGRALDFESYMDNWTSAATSLRSDGMNIFDQPMAQPQN